MPSKIIFTKAQDNFIIKYGPKINQKKLTEKFNAKFNTNISWYTISKHRKELGISGICKKFQKGHKPWNTGKHVTPEQYEKMKPNMFKKGSKPSNLSYLNRKPLYSEMVTKEGIIWIKVREGHGFGNWERKSRWVYEQHYGKLPKDMVVIFLDRNQRNFDINNLCAIKRSVQMQMTVRKLYSEDAEQTKTGSYIAQIYDIVSKGEKKYEKENKKKTKRENICNV